MLSCTSPRMPCWGPKSVPSSKADCSPNTSAICLRSGITDAWLHTRPMRLPRIRSCFSSSRRSTPSFVLGISQKSPSDIARALTVSKLYLMRLRCVDNGSFGCVFANRCDTVLHRARRLVHLALADGFTVGGLHNEISRTVFGGLPFKTLVVTCAFFYGLDALRGTTARLVSFAGEYYLAVAGLKVKTEFAGSTGFDL